MASIFLYNPKGGKCVELSCAAILEEDIDRLRAALPPNLEGLAFESPIDKLGEDSISEVRKEEREGRIAEYLKGIGNKLEELNQSNSALRFYDLAFRLSKNSEILMLQARTLRQLGMVDKAENLIKHYAKSNPNAPEPYFLFGKHALSRSDYEKAMAHFEDAKKRIRSGNVEHKKLQEALDIYTRFVRIYLERDKLFTRNLDPGRYIEEIEKLRRRAQVLSEDIKKSNDSELEGMAFFLDTQGQIFSRWLEELNNQS
jgi:tetratricopeptide (TPR) repeat protein